jgi:hypothetical protein
MLVVRCACGALLLCAVSLLGGTNRFCGYQDARGVPGQGSHAARLETPLGSLALVDLAQTAAWALLINVWISWGSPLLRWLRRAAIVGACLWALGTLLHGAACVDTPVTRLFFPPRVNPVY